MHPWILPRRTILPVLLLSVLAYTTTASAKQIRINVTGSGGPTGFSPSTAAADTGDHVVWIWGSGTHTVTSGDHTTVADPSVGDGVFNSGGASISAATFSWKVRNSLATQPYYCIPHADMGMTGTLNISASGSSGLSDFRITEVQFNAASNLDLIEITNLGAAGDLGKYRLKISGVTTTTLQIGASTNIAIPASGRIVLHLAASGTNTTTDLFFPGIAGLPANGSVALYVPSTVASQSALNRADMMIDYVQWGAAGQENEATANAGHFWTTGTAVTGVAAGHSIEFCGNSGEYGFPQWAEISTPNFGSDGNCLTPAIPSSWGRLKTIYH